MFLFIINYSELSSWEKNGRFNETFLFNIFFNFEKCIYRPYEHTFFIINPIIQERPKQILKVENEIEFR